ncbi:LLM class flavin-dependent oxidoreductase [Brevibacillus antibioticus]|uniref:LLM class flavin-dependent oxidoreductase n=1 Tax=Brevibacillus antibioticus TaxID=2570228 RepID=A0A4U2Y3M0_9BACL|nr:LLM class flavin-dependent oxidoreductase [Brevibacillus antibioticus]TKI55066.1 LLM class flavin-dependent oxidoreductase [Brevibacillus antibioticus]
MRNTVEVYSDFKLPISQDYHLDEILQTMKSLECNHFTGVLLSYKNSTLDPFVVACAVLQHTTTFTPLVAVQPYNMPPHSLAKKVHAICHLYNRRINLNMISGSIKQDLLEVKESLDKKGRYHRLVEYTNIIRKLFASSEPLTWESINYQYDQLTINSALPSEIIPKLFVASGSLSSLAMDAIRSCGDSALMIPDCLDQFLHDFHFPLKDAGLEFGIKINIIARPTADEALQVAKQEKTIFRVRQLFKSQRQQAGMYSLLEKDVFFPRTDMDGDSSLVVGSYDKVTEYLTRYVEYGVRSIIIGNAYTSPEEMKHCGEIIDRLNHCVAAS